MRETRAGKAGKILAKSIIEMVHLMYQHNTARNFLKGLLKPLIKEAKKKGVTL